VSRLSFFALLRFYLPLALSGLLMTLQQPVVMSVIARTTSPKESLAAYGLALSVAVLLESPIQMLLTAGAVLAHDKPSFRLLQRSTLAAGATLAGLAAILAFTPLGQVFFHHILSAPSKISAHTVVALRVMVFWPLVVAWRRLYQGILISLGQTRAISYGTVGRLVVIAAVAFLVAVPAGGPGAVAGTSALMAGAVFEALFVTGWLRLAGRSMNDAHSETEALTLGRLGRFYWPLALTSVLTVLSWPLINAGIGRSAMSEQSLAAWPVILSLLWLFTTPLQMLQQMTIALAADTDLRAVRHFALGFGAVMSGLLGLICFTPLLEVLLVRVLTTPAEIIVPVVLAGRLLVPLPFLAATEAFCQGFLIQRKCTAVVRTAMGINLLVLSSAFIIGTQRGSVPGFLLAPAAMTAGLLAEVGWLWRHASAHLTPLE